MSVQQARVVRIEDELARRGFPFWTKPRHNNLGGPCPMCGGHDRFSVHTKKQIFFCRVCEASGDVINLVQFLDGASFKVAVETLAGAAGGQVGSASYVHTKAPEKAVSESTNEAQRMADLVAWLWSRREPVSESNAAGRYLRNRGYAGHSPATLGYLPPNGKHPPAMIAAFGFCDEPEPGLIVPPKSITGVHLTRLTMDGDKAPIKPVKIMLGPSTGLPIVLAPVNDGLGLALAEGIEDGLSVFEETGLGTWAAGSAGNMPKIAAALPTYVECVTIFAHRDKTGMRFAKEAARLIAAMGTEVHIKGRG
jgi:Toprim domain/CHC2 zinc finger